MNVRPDGRSRDRPAGARDQARHLVDVHLLQVSEGTVDLQEGPAQQVAPEGRRQPRELLSVDGELLTALILRPTPGRTRDTSSARYRASCETDRASRTSASLTAGLNRSSCGMSWDLSRLRVRSGSRLDSSRRGARPSSRQ